MLNHIRVLIGCVLLLPHIIVYSLLNFNSGG